MAGHPLIKTVARPEANAHARRLDERWERIAPCHFVSECLEREAQELSDVGITEVFLGHAGDYLITVEHGRQVRNTMNFAVEKPAPTALPTLLDGEGFACYTRVPNIEFPEPQPISISGLSFSRLQTHSWFMFLRAKGAMALGQPHDQVHLGESETLAWLKQELIDVGVDDADVDGYSAEQIKVEELVPEQTLQRVEDAVPGSAGTYMYGPDLSALWSAFSGKVDGRALAVFKARTGLSFQDIAGADSRLLECLLDAAPVVSLHATAALVETFVSSYRGSLGSAKAVLQLLHPAAHFELQRRARANDDALAARVLSDPWYEKLIVCLCHESTVRRLALHGLCLQDLLLATGKPRLTPISALKFRWGYDPAKLQPLRLRVPQGVAVEGLCARATEIGVGSLALQLYAAL